MIKNSTFRGYSAFIGIAWIVSSNLCGAGDLTVDNLSVSTNATVLNGKLGVGTSSPAAKASIIESGSDKGMIVKASGNTIMELQSDAVGGNGVAFSMNHIGRGYVSGMLNVGTPNFGTSLSVKSENNGLVADFASAYNSDDRSMIRFSSLSSQYMYLGAASRTNYSQFAVYNSGAHSSVPMLVVNDNINGGNGYVGVNTNTPAERLHVVGGNIRLDGGQFIGNGSGLLVSPQGDLSMGTFTSGPQP
jgi:hypothetical protein